MVTEIELKYSLLKSNDLLSTQQINEKICQLLTEHKFNFVHKEKQLSNHYFDTETLTLRKYKIALRTRGTTLDGTESFEQTIKTSGTVIAGLHQRPEYNVDIKNDKPILSLFPQSIWQERAGIDVKQLQQDIIELFSTNFTRHTWLVSLADAQIEIAFDSGEVACQDYANKPSIYEVELELVTGDAQALLLLTKILFSQLPLRPGQLTKAARGYALYHQSIVQKSQANSNQVNVGENTSTAKSLHKCGPIEQASQVMIPLTKDNALFEAFQEGVSFSLTQLQLEVDSCVTTYSLATLNKISGLLALLRQGFRLFNELLTQEELKLRDELSYFIRTIHWVDNARYIQALNSKQSSYQKEVALSQELIQKLQLTQNRYPNAAQVIELLHSERFNNLQLNLLSLLLKKANEPKRQVAQSLALFSASHLAQSTKALGNELVELSKPIPSSSTDLYLSAHSTLIRALLTSSWFSGLFADLDSSTVKTFNMPWLDIKERISELQSLNLMQQQLVHLPNPERKLASWLADKSENLITALDQSISKSLTMKPYWK
ncbi:MAG: CYTH domain-containing protein [Colwellia sp.]|nr:CYTH domain-containing protein [Colwellia sp.]